MRYIGSLCVASFYSVNFLCYNRSPEKRRVPALKRLRLSEFWTYKDGTRFILESNEVSIVFFTLQTYSVVFFLLINL